MKKYRTSTLHKYERWMRVGTFLILFILFISLSFWVKYVNEGRLIRLSDKVVKNFRVALDYEMVNLLSFSMAFSEDGELKNALLQDDEVAGHKTLNSITERFKKYTHLKSLRIQIITPNFFIFARSWDEGFEGMPIWWFRDDLGVLKKKREPKVGVETGRLLTFKATVPIRSRVKLLGYLEVITLLDEFVQKLHQKGIELFVMMDEKYLEKAELMYDFPRIDKYVISNRNYNQLYLNHLKRVNWEALISEDYIYDKKTLFLSEPMYNSEGRQIGYYIFAIAEDMIEQYEKEKSSFSLLSQFSNKDIEKVVETWRSPADSFKNIKDKELVDLLPKLHKEDKKELELRAKSILRTYTKGELIDIILSKKYREKKVGIIK
ncbi:MAG: hypothetical protein LGB78_05605 [Sulfurovum sp.]|nr:hypothetical protein [Sulfurovum sp.]